MKLNWSSYHVLKRKEFKIDIGGEQELKNSVSFPIFSFPLEQEYVMKATICNAIVSLSNNVANVTFLKSLIFFYFDFSIYHKFDKNNISDKKKKSVLSKI